MRRLRALASGELAPLWDSHVHLPAYPDPREVVRDARSRGIRLVSVTVAPAEGALNLSLREENPSAVRAFIGVHPSEAENAPAALERLAPLWERADGVGEVGLDPKYSEVSRESAQMKLFRGQVEAASRLRKPLEVHSRGAEQACLDLLDGHSPRSVLMHWFEGEEHLERVVSRANYFVSFGPALLYSKKLLRMARRLPPESVLVESDVAGPLRCAGRRGGSRAGSQRRLQARGALGQEPGRGGHPDLGQFGEVSEVKGYLHPRGGSLKTWIESAGSRRRSW